MNKQNKEKWLSILDDQSSSGCSVSKYCKEHGLNTKTFYSYRRKLIGLSQGSLKPVVIESSDNTMVHFSFDGIPIQMEINDLMNIIKMWRNYE